MKPSVSRRPCSHRIWLDWTESEDTCDPCRLRILRECIEARPAAARAALRAMYRAVDYPIKPRPVWPSYEAYQTWERQQRPLPQRSGAPAVKRSGRVWKMAKI